MPSWRQLLLRAARIHLIAEARRRHEEAVPERWRRRSVRPAKAPVEQLEDRLLLAGDLEAIRGEVFVDLDADQERDRGERLLAGVSVYVDADRDGQVDRDEPTGVTDARGRFALDAVGKGIQDVRVVTPAGMADPGTKRIAASDTGNRDLSFGLRYDLAMRMPEQADPGEVVWLQWRGEVPNQLPITIDWGDRDVNTSVRLTGAAMHVYSEPGIYEVQAWLQTPEGNQRIGSQFIEIGDAKDAAFVGPQRKDSAGGLFDEYEPVWSVYADRSQEARADLLKRASPGSLTAALLRHERLGDGSERGEHDGRGPAGARSAAASGGPISVLPNADGYALRDSQTRYGGDVDLFVSNGLRPKETQREAFLRFDVSAFAGTPSAKLRLPVISLGPGAGSMDLRVDAISSENLGQEYMLGWQSSLANATVQWTQAVAGVSAGTLEVDVSDAIRAAADLADPSNPYTDPGTITFRLRSMNQVVDQWVHFGSRDHTDPALRPTLLVEPVVPEVSIAADSTLPGSGQVSVDLAATLQPDDLTFAGTLNNGVAADDARTGTGYLMYSAESVHTRFAGANVPHSSNADHFIAVVYQSGQWHYDDNGIDGVLNSFTPRDSDLLVAELDFSANAATLLVGADTVVHGIPAGYASGDLTITPQQWGGVTNDGEFGLSGSSITPNRAPVAEDALDFGDLGWGVAAVDNRSGTGWMMYSEESVHTRFSASAPNADNADHFIAVVLQSGQWYYDNNLSLTAFTPEASDLLVAELDFSANTATTLQGTHDVVHDVTAGYIRGDLAITPQVWNGGTNDGEFEVAGGVIVPHATPAVTWTIDWGDGTPLETATGSMATVTHTYADATMTYTVRAAADHGSGYRLPGGSTYDTMLGQQLPIAAWSLEDLTGQGALPWDADESIGTHDGTYENALNTSWDAPPSLLQPGRVLGEVNESVNFWPGFLEVVDDPDFDLSAGTFSFVFRDTHTIEDAGLLFKSVGSGNNAGDFELYTVPFGNLGLWGTLQGVIKNEHSPFVVDTLNAPLYAAGSWNHLAFSWGPAGMKVYLNGELAGTHAYDMGTHQPTALDLIVGMAKSGQSVFSGEMDELALFDRQLTPDEVMRQHLAEGAALTFTPPGSAGGDFTLTEGTRLVTTDTDENGTRTTFMVPGMPDGYRIDFSSLSFDAAGGNPLDANDAFELALLDADTGGSVVPTIGNGRDAFFNASQGEAPLLASGVALVDSNNVVVSTLAQATGVVVDISGLTPDAEVQPVARLVNNDADNSTTVTVDFNLGTSGGGTSVAIGDGTITRDYWTGISGGFVVDLTGHANYPNNPTGSDTLDRIHGLGWNDPLLDASLDDYYGQRIHGYLVPRKTGNHTFWLSAWDRAELWLSTDDDSANRVKIAEVTSPTDLFEWDDHAAQKSVSISLVAGESYFIEVIHKAHSGEPDHLEVGWVQPGETGTEPIQLVPTEALSTTIATVPAQSPGMGTSDAFVAFPAGATESNAPAVRAATADRNVAFTALRDVTDRFDLSYAHTSYNEATGVVTLGLDLLNESDDKLRDDLLLAIRRVRGQDTTDPADARLTAFDGLLPVSVGGLPAGTPYLSLFDALPKDAHGFLDDDASLDDLTIQFKDTDPSDRFDYDIVLLSRINAAPYFTSSPYAGQQGQAFPLLDADDQGYLQVEVGQPFSYTLDSEDPDGDRVSYSIVGTPPAALSLVTDPDTGDVSLAGTFTNVNATPYEVTLRATDEFGTYDPASDQVVRIQPVSASGNHRPDFITEPIRHARTGVEYLYDSDAFDRDGDTLTYTLNSATYDDDGTTVSVASEMVVDPSSGALTWTPGLELADRVVSISLSVADNAPLSDTQNYDLLVLPGTAADPQVDLEPQAIDTTGLYFDQQKLTVEGVVKLNAVNHGIDDVDSPFTLLVFEDLDFDGAYSAANDQLVGSALITSGVKGRTAQQVAAPITGSVSFAGAPLWVMLDSNLVIDETDETNNTASSSDNCFGGGVFDPEVRWSAGFNSYITPVVGDIDGINGPDLLTISSDGHLVAIDGGEAEDDVVDGFVPRSEAILDIDLGISEDQSLWASTPVIADVDDDGDIEIFTTGMTSHNNVDYLEIRAFHLDNGSWTQYWSSTAADGLRGFKPGGGLSIADLDEDGTPEIIAGAAAYNATTGAMLWNHNGGQYFAGTWQTTAELSTGANYHTGLVDEVGSMSIAADLNPAASDGLEVIAGNIAYKADGTVFADWSSVNPAIPNDGIASVANFDTDAEPEIAVMSRGVLYLINPDGSAVWSSHSIDLAGPAITSSGFGERGGGAPVIANFDDDAALEIGVHSGVGYHVVDDNGTELSNWITPPDEEGPGAVGISFTLFDFDGDGRQEMVIPGGLNLRVLQADTGIVLYEPPLKNHVAPKNIVVADTNGDGKAEFIVAGLSIEDGVAHDTYCVFGSETYSWMDTSPVWNQLRYHRAHIESDMGVPAPQPDHWIEANDFGLNRQLTTGTGPAADLIPSYLRVDEAAGYTRLIARVGNAGSVDVLAGVPIKFYDGDPSGSNTELGVVTTTDPIPVGGYLDIELVVSGTVASAWVVADDETANNPVEDVVDECNETNNAYSYDLGIQPRPANDAPTIDSTPVRLAVPGEPYAYQVMASDDNDDVLAYELIDGPDGMRLDATTGLLSWSPGYDQSGERYAVRVRVTDGRGGRDTQSFYLAVQSDNVAPTLREPSFSDAIEGQAWSVTLEVDDPDGALPMFELLDGPTGATLDPVTGVLSWTPPSGSAGSSYRFAVSVSDGRGGESFGGFELTVGDGQNGVNNSPVITSKPAGYVYRDTEWSYQVVAEDDDGAAGITYSVDARGDAMSVTIHETSGLLTWTPLAEGTFSFTIYATDAAGLSGTQTLTIPVNPPGAAEDRAPQFTLEPRTAPIVGRAWSDRVIAIDPDGQAVTYTLEDKDADLSALTIDAQSGELSWPAPVAGTYRFTVRATAGGLSETLDVALAVLADTAPIVISAPAWISGNTGANVSIPIQVIDWQGGTGTVSVLPSSAAGSDEFTLVGGGTTVALSTDPSNPSAFTLEFEPDDAGLQSVAIQITDDTGRSTTTVVLLDVASAGGDPSIVVDSPPVIGLGQTFRARAQGIDPDGDTLTYAIVPVTGAPTLPTSAIDPATGVITWTPTAITTTGNPVKFKVSVSGGSVAPVVTDEITLVVQTDDVQNTAPRITSQPFGRYGAWDTPLVYPAVAEDDQGDALRWSVQGPSSAAIDPVTGRFVWHPTNDELERSQVARITVTDAYGLSDSQLITLSTTPGENENHPPVLAAADGLVAALNKSFTFDTPASDPDGQTLKYKLVDSNGDLVDTDANGFSIDNNGVVTWTATGTQASFTVHVTDPLGDSAERTYSVTVIDGAVPTLELRLSDDSPSPGQTINITVLADDAVGITGQTLTVTENWSGGQTAQTLTINGSNTATYTLPDDATGTFTLDATATNVEGTTVPRSRVVDVDPISSDAPVVFIKSVYAGQAITEPLDITGWAFVDDIGDTADTVTLALLPDDGGAAIELVSYANTDVGSSGSATSLGELTPANVPNGSYRLLLTATNSGAQSTYEVPVTIDTPVAAKVGNFRTSVTDLTVAVGGLPITVQRTYDSDDRDKVGDFGHGWSMDLLSGKAEVSNLAGDSDRGGTLGTGAGFLNGTRVELTLPGGEKVGYTAIAMAEDGIDGILSGGGNGLLVLAFVPDAGVFSRLDLVGNGVKPSDYPPYVEVRLAPALASLPFGSPQVSTQSETGEILLNGASFNPAHHNGMKYRLTTPDGTEYLYIPGTGQLDAVTTPTGETLSFGADIFAQRNGEETGRLVIERDDLGRIEKVYDAAAPSLVYEYTYDANGDLAVVTDRTDRTTTMAYGDGITEPSHYLTSVTDGTGQTVLQIGTDDDGLLGTIQDASGEAADFLYETATGPGGEAYTVEVVRDADDIRTEIARDTNGNVVRQTQQVSATDYLVTVTEYDPEDRPIKTYRPFTATGAARFSDAPAASTLASETVYNEHGLPTQVTDAQGLTTTYEYDNALNLLRVIDPNQQATTTKTTGGLLRETIDTTGQVTRYLYDNFNQLEAVKLKQGGKEITLSSSAHDTKGRLLQTTGTDPDGTPNTADDPVTRSFAYNAVGDQTHSWHTQDGKTLVSVTAYDAEGRTLGSAQYTIDELTGDYEDQLGDLLTPVTTGVSTSPAHWTNPTGDYIAPDTYALTYYDAAGRAAVSIDPFGLEIHTLYDTRGNVVETRRQTTLANGNPAWTSSRTVYDANGRATTSSGPILLTNATAPYTINGSGIASIGSFNPSNDSVLDPATESTPANNDHYRASLTIYDDAGRTTDTYRYAGNPVTLTLDTTTTAQGRYSTAFSSTGTTELSHSSTTYDSQGRVASTTSPTGSVTKTVYDPDTGRVTQTITDDGGTHEATTNYYYDPLGRQQFTLANATGNAADRVLTQTVYDDLGRASQTIQHVNTTVTTTNGLHTVTADPGDATTTTVYDTRGRRTAEIDPLNRRTDYRYNDAGQLLQVTLPQLDTQDVFSDDGDHIARPSWSYQYDEQGNQTAITDPLGRLTTFTHDHNGRQTQRTLPLGQPNELGTGFTESMTYFPDEVTPTNPRSRAGQLQLATDFEGRTTAYTYDSQGRVATKTYANGSTSRTLTYTYDAFGRTKTIVDSVHGTTTHTYDAEGRLYTQTTPEGTLNYRYNSLGQHTDTITSNSHTQYTYDTLGRLKTVHATAGPTATTNPTTYTYDKLGRPATETATNGAVKTITFDTRSRVTQIKHERPSAGGTLAQFDYTHDAVGNRTSSTEQFDTDTNGTLDHSQTFTYDYDVLNRLRTETFDSDTNADDYVHHYRFDANTNRKAWNKDEGSTNPFTTTYDEQVNYTHDANDRLLTETTDTGKSTAYQYGGPTSPHTNQTKKTLDDNGTVTTTDYTYNEMGRLSGVTITTGGSSTTETYGYNAQGLRVESNDGTDTVTYLFDNQNPTGYAQVLEEDSTTNADDKTYTLGLDVLNHTSTAGLLTLLYDAHGSTRMLLDTAASVLTHGGQLQFFTYDAYGNSLGFDPSASLTTLLYSGQWTSALTGDQYLRDRFYQSPTARFTRTDSFLGAAGSPMTYHRYGYTHSDPIQGTDPTGRFNYIELLSVAKIRTTLSSMYISAYTAGHYAAWGAAAGKSIESTFAAMMLDMLLEPIDIGVEIFAYVVDLVQGYLQGGFSAIFGSPSPGPVSTASAGSGGIVLIGSWIASRYGSLRYHNKLYLPSNHGRQANHLNQKKAFPQIPDNDGFAVNLRGSTSQYGSEHWRFHIVLEEFWDDFRVGGIREGEFPTRNEYNRAAVRALDNVGVSRRDRARALILMRIEQTHYNVPRRLTVIPGRIPAMPRVPRI